MPTGYTLHVGMGSGEGNLISEMASTVQQCTDACNQVPNCVGFTMLDSTRRKLKSFVTLTISSGKDTYVKEAGGTASFGSTSSLFLFPLLHCLQERFQDDGDSETLPKRTALKHVVSLFHFFGLPGEPDPTKTGSVASLSLRAHGFAPNAKCAHMGCRR